LGEVKWELKLFGLVTKKEQIKAGERKKNRDKRNRKKNGTILERMFIYF